MKLTLALLLNLSNRHKNLTLVVIQQVPLLDRAWSNWQIQNEEQKSENVLWCRNWHVLGSRLHPPTPIHRRRNKRHCNLILDWYSVGPSRPLFIRKSRGKCSYQHMFAVCWAHTFGFLVNTTRYKRVRTFISINRRVFGPPLHIIDIEQSNFCCCSIGSSTR